VYPERALAQLKEGRVELFVTIGKEGDVGAVEVALSAGTDLDAAAVAAVRLWKFAPAEKDGVRVASRIRIAFDFVVPTDQAPPPHAATDGGTQPSEDEGIAADNSSPEAGGASSEGAEKESDAPAEQETEPIDESTVRVRGRRANRTESRAISDFTLDRELLAAAPRKNGAEVLRSTPGLYIGQGEGPAVAHSYMLRGFDAEHGQDIEFRVGGLPINMPSHIHGQGYADLGFLIPDAVLKLRASEGVYDPRQGDFAVAGSIDVELGVAGAERGVRLSSSYGSFNTFRQLGVWAPPDAPEESFGAARYERTDGFGENRGGQSGSMIVQSRFGDGDVTYRALGILHAARADVAGVLRLDDVESGQACFYCTYPHPTAEAQNALAQRFLSGFFIDYSGSDGANGQMGVWLGYDNFRLQANYTGFTERSRTLVNVSGRGELIEQRNSAFSMGLTGRYRTAPYDPVSFASGTVEVGVDGRFDVTEQAQNLLDASVRGQTWDERVDATVRGVDVGFWGDLDWSLWSWLRARAGVRADALSFDIGDRLGNFAPATRPTGTYIVGFRRSATGLAWGPRASVEARVISGVSLMAAYGEGYRSPQARLLEDGEAAPFSRVRSMDAGIRVNLASGYRFTLGGYYTTLSDDVAFDASEGALTRIGATQRAGAIATIIARPVDWFVGAVSATYVDATLLEPPPPTAEEPLPPFAEGESLPFIPPLVVRADVGITGVLMGSDARPPVVGHAG